MRKPLVLILGICLLGLFIGSASAREARIDKQIMRSLSDEEYNDPQLIDAGVRDMLTAANVDTFCLVWYDFEMMDYQGWTIKDQTAQVDIFTHVDDFVGLGGGSWGGLVALEGTKSMWCGTRPGTDEYLCSWTGAPGYGNDWNQILISDVIEFQGILTFSYHGYFDSEPDFDQTYVEYDAGSGNWVEIAMYDGAVDTIATHELLLSQAKTKLRFHFTADGAWSDSDGLWDTDGGFIVDSIVVADIGGLIDYEDFESAAVGAHVSGIWTGTEEAPYGTYGGLYSNLADKDPCGDNFATQVVFFIGSSYPSSDYPGLFDTPFCLGAGNLEAPCQTELLVSPIIDMTKYSSAPNAVQDQDIPAATLPSLGGALLRFTTYRDLPTANLVFYTWQVRNWELLTATPDPDDRCPSAWLDRNYVYYGPDKDYIFTTQDVSDLLTGDPMQVGIGVSDMCDVWYLVYGNCAAHTPSPWFDNVRVYRYQTVGPQWSWRDLDIFQDNFPEVEFNLESYVRIDAANDLRGNDDPIIDPGDSAVVSCTAPLGGGIDTTADGWPMVYCNVRIRYIGDPLNPKPAIFGPTVADNTTFYGRYDSDDGVSWTKLQCDYASAGAGIAEDKYMVDMNDSLLTRGYIVEYYFEAKDRNGEWSTLPRTADEGTFFEMTALPTLASDVLFVNDMHSRGGIMGIEFWYWDPVFKNVLPAENYPDRFDVNSPSSLVSNSLGSRAKNYHLTTAYRKIFWEGGDLDEGVITDGTTDTDKSNDTQALIDWMEFAPNDVGLWVAGDQAATDLNNSTAGSALSLLNTYCGVEWVDGSYYDLTGGRLAGGTITPFVYAPNTPNNPLYHTTWGDSFYVFGGCPIINSFDVLEKTSGGEYALQYPDYGGESYYAGIFNTGINDGGFDIRTMWFGFSFAAIRDVTSASPTMANIVAKDIISWMQNDTESDITESEIPRAYSLSQNFPNPFNPTTEIRFALRAKGNVSLKVYDVAGRLVKTLANEVRDAGSYNVTWDGTNNSGVKVASGVYFYKMDTREFNQTKKMVLLR
ncbi:MAG: T9SS type A sorting domain-containing protein [Candidatus Krumholzibacteriota bacterium]|nr:T9SS type A sorting domain-containing protein [Candidatus Krumholzibacteriota bacterium]